MTINDTAIREAGQIIAEAAALRDSLSVEEAARQAYTPTGPSIEQLEERIRAQRARRIGAAS